MKLSSMFLAVACLVAGMSVLMMGCTNPDGPFYITAPSGTSEVQVGQPVTYNFYLPVGCELQRLDIKFPDDTSTSIVRDSGGIDNAEFFIGSVAAVSVAVGIVNIALYHCTGGLWYLNYLAYMKAEAPDGGEMYTITKVYSFPIKRGVIEAVAKTSCGDYGANLAIKVVPQTKPVAFITSPGQNSQVLVGGQVNFTASDAGAGAEYQWQFSSGEIATGQSFSTSFEEGEVGPWWVTLSVFANGLMSDAYTVDFSVVSNGPTMVTVPNLSGLNWAQAEVLLGGFNLAVGDVSTETSDSVPPNIIIRWSPTGSVPTGSLINIVVSTGPGTNNGTVPNLSGLTEQQAIDAINGTCLEIGTITRSSSNTVPAGQVISWSPTGSQPCGTLINLVVSTGPASSTPMSVAILSPGNGATFHVGDKVAVRVLPDGDLARGPYKLVVSCAGKKILTKADIEKILREKSLPAAVVTNAVMGQEYVFEFDLTMFGSAWFSAYLEAADGSYVTSSSSYTVFEN